jgi:hypothetical protein
MRYAVYRCLYGEDFIQESIRSISDHVDRVFVFWTNKPWGSSSGCEYKGTFYKFPEKFDNLLERIHELNDPKVTLIKAHTDTPDNQLTHYINSLVLPNFDRPEFIMFLEPDHVFRDDQINGMIDDFMSSGATSLSTRQVELWKTPDFRIPERTRCGSMLWNMTGLDVMPNTRFHADVSPVRFTDRFVHNFGFCVSDLNMFWKHLTALAFSREIGDSVPNVNWLDDTWRNWHPKTNNRNLEISLGYEHLIPYAEPYPASELPKSIVTKYKENGDR